MDHRGKFFPIRAARLQADCRSMQHHIKSNSVTMNIQRRIILLCSLCAGLSLLAADKPSLDSHLEPLRPLLDKTWKGAFKDSTPDKPIVDVMRWERALNGNAVRVVHSINNGNYGGETIIRWDEKQQVVTY